MKKTIIFAILLLFSLSYANSARANATVQVTFAVNSVVVPKRAAMLNLDPQNTQFRIMSWGYFYYQIADSGGNVVISRIIKETAQPDGVYLDKNVSSDTFSFTYVTGSRPYAARIAMNPWSSATDNPTADCQNVAGGSYYVVLQYFNGASYSDAICPAPPAVSNSNRRNLYLPSSSPVYFNFLTISL